MNLLQFALAGLIAAHAGISPCTGIEMPIPPDWARVRTAIAKQLNVPSVEPLRYSVSLPWRVFEVDVHQPSSVVIAFEGGDMRPPYIVGSLWNGSDTAPSARNDAIRKWALEKAPRMPPRLLDCLAWHVTKKP